MKVDMVGAESRRGWRTLGLALALGLGAVPRTSAQTCPITVDNINVTGVVNTYYPGASALVSAGATSVQIDRNPNAVGGADQNIAVGDLLVIMQMQDADINSTNTDSYGNGVAGLPASGQTPNPPNAGRYEYVLANSAVTVQTAGADVVTMNILGAGTGNGTLYSYRTVARTTTAGQRAFQVVKVMRYRNATLNNVSAPTWNGIVGGVVAIDVTQLLTLSALSVDVSGDGFRGAPGQQLTGEGGNGANTDYRRASTLDAHGLKGEGIVGSPTGLAGVTGTSGYPTTVAAEVNGDRARGAPGNGGGGGSDFDIGANDENSGGGGGGNGGPGGTGGNSWNSNAAIGGFGGALFPATFDKVALGGGGGAGTRNNSDNIPLASSGAAGGGIILIRAANVAGTGIVRADGASANVAAFIPENDAGGGGGAGGSVIFVSRAGVSLANLTVEARGGRGSNAWPTEPAGGFPGARHGPGGGGGGGVYFVSSAPNAASSVIGGPNGTTTQDQSSYGAGGGNGSANISGSTDINDIPGIQTCLTVTRAVIEGLRRVGDDIEFGVASGRGVQGFNVIAENRAGRRELLNDELLPSPLPDALGPVLFRVALRGRTPRRVFVEEVERGGRSRMMGPYVLGDERLAEAYARLEDRAAASSVWESSTSRMLAGPRSTRPRRRPPTIPRRRPQPGASAVKVLVGEEGVVRLEARDWPADEAAGPRSVDAQRRRLRVTNLGRPVPFAIREGGLEFTAESLSADYSGENAYLVSWSPVPAPAAALTRSGFPEAPGFVRVEQNTLYAPFVAQGADPWIWDLALAGTTGSFAFDVPRLAAGTGNAAVRIGIIGGSDHPHRVQAEINGAVVGDLEFTGKTAALLRGAVPLTALHATGNQLVLRYDAEASTPEDPGLIFLDVVDLAVAQDAPTAPAEVRAVTGYDARIPDLQGVSYLIVTHPDFAAAADRLRALKEQAGFRTAVVDVERAYDRFTGGVADVAAVRELVRLAARGRALQYVLLVGDDAYDTRDFTGQGLTSFLPTPYGWDGVFGRVPSEIGLSDLDGDGRPDLAIGRLPVRTADEAAAVVDKIARQATRPGRRRHVIAVDESQPGDISFRGEGEALRAQLPGTVEFADVGAQGVAAARTTLIDSLRTGVRTANYFGHGGFDVLSDQGLLRSADVALLEGSNAETVFFAWTCETQWYVGERRTLNEELLLVPNGGSVASLGPGGISDPALQAALSRRVYALVLNGWTLGRAVQRAKAEAMAEDPGLSSVVEGFTLLGDPSLRP